MRSVSYVQCVALDFGGSLFPHAICLGDADNDAVRRPGVAAAGPGGRRGPRAGRGGASSALAWWRRLRGRGRGRRRRGPGLGGQLEGAQQRAVALRGAKEPGLAGLGSTPGLPVAAVGGQQRQGKGRQSQVVAKEAKMELGSAPRGWRGARAGSWRR